MHFPKFEETMQKLCSNVNNANPLKRKILSENEECKRHTAKCAEIAEQTVCAENLYCEIDFGCDGFKTKYDVDFTQMNDYQILELNKARNLDNELNGILDKITRLASLVPGYEVQRMLDKAIILRTEMSKRKEKFITELQTIMLERDISES